MDNVWKESMEAARDQAKKAAKHRRNSDKIVCTVLAIVNATTALDDSENNESKYGYETALKFIEEQTRLLCKISKCESDFDEELFYGFVE